MPSHKHYKACLEERSATDSLVFLPQQLIPQILKKGFQLLQRLLASRIVPCPEDSRENYHA